MSDKQVEENAAGPSEKKRMLFGASVMRGYRVEIQDKSGDIWEGVFSLLNIEGPSYSVVIRYPKKRLSPGSKDKDDLATRPEECKVFDAEDLVMVTAKEVKIVDHDHGGDEGGIVGGGGFETDAAIGKGQASGHSWGRELQKWQPEESEDADPLWLEQEGGGLVGGGGGGAWDQFAANSQLFGVETTWDEHQYTTKINRDRCNISEEDAERIAREIESGLGATGNLHMDEERGIKGDDSGAGQDEEDKYSSVVRPGAKGQPSPFPASTAQKGPAWGGKGSGVAAVAGPKASASPPPPPPPPKIPPPVASTDKASVSLETSSSTPSLSAPTPTGDPSSSEGGKQVTVKAEEVKKPSSLNPNATVFSLNVGAKAFVPSPAAATPAPAPAQSGGGGGSRQGQGQGQGHHDSYRHSSNFSQRPGGGGGFELGGYMAGGYGGMAPQGGMMDPNGIMMMQGGGGGYPGSMNPIPSPPQGSVVPLFAGPGGMRQGGMQAIVMTHPPMPFYSGPGPNGPQFFPMAMEGGQPQRHGNQPGYPHEGQSSGYGHQ